MRYFESFFLLIALLFATQAKAAQIELLTQYPQQGSMIIGKYTGQGDVYFAQQKLQKSKKGVFVFGVGRNSATQIFLTIKNDGPDYRFPITIKSRQWQIEKVDGLPPSKISPKSRSVLERINQEAKLVKVARNKLSDFTFFEQTSILPANGRISGVYGSQRILNGEPKRPHFGLDIANKVGTAIFAPIDGQVLLIHPDMFYSGGTLVIDHGYGISSTYIHLNSIEVKEGQMVKQGEQIATMGATGRATGPHLDWRLNWFQTRLDPQLLISSQ